MEKKRNHSNWLGLILFCSFMLGLLWLEVKAPFSEAGHTWAEVGLVLLLFSLVLVWLKANEHAMLMEEMDEYRRRTSQRASQPNQNLTRSTANTIENRNGKNHSPEHEKHLGGRVLPAWLISLSSVIVGFLKALDK